MDLPEAHCSVSADDFWFCFVIDGVAATDGPWGDAVPSHSFYRMYQHWLQTFSSKLDIE